MTRDQQERLDDILSQQDQVVRMWMDYWKDFSNWETWQFWAIVLMLIVPLIIIYFAIDKNKVFQIGFYGFNIHAWFTYSDTIAMRTSHVTYPFQAIPVLPVNFALDASFVPVSFMLLYQWCINHNKNVFLYGMILSAFFAFIFKPLLVLVNLMQINKGFNYIYLFLNYVVILFLAVVITKVFTHINRKRDHKK